MADAIYKITFSMSDGSTKDIEFTAPQGPKGDPGATNSYCGDLAIINNIATKFFAQYANHGSVVGIRFIFYGYNKLRLNYTYNGNLNNTEIENVSVLSFYTYNDIMNNTWKFRIEAYDSTGNSLAGGPADSLSSIVNLSGYDKLGCFTLFGADNLDIASLIG